MILIGAGGHAMSLAELGSDAIFGYLAHAENPDLPGKWLGDDSMAASLVRDGHLFHMAFIYSGLPKMDRRAELLSYYKEIGAHFATIISPHAIVTQNSRIGIGSAIMTGAIINRAQVGENCVINSGAIIEHDCEIGDNTFVGPGAVIGGFTNIGRNCFIGLGAKIANGITIADNITVAMGAIVNKDLIEPGLYHGYPLHLFKI